MRDKKVQHAAGHQKLEKDIDGDNCVHEKTENEQKILRRQLSRQTTYSIDRCLANGRLIMLYWFF